MNRRQKKKLNGRTGTVFGVKVTLTPSECRELKKKSYDDKVDFLIDKARAKKCTKENRKLQ